MSRRNLSGFDKTIFHVGKWTGDMVFYISYYTLKKNNDIIDVLKNMMEYYV